MKHKDCESDLLVIADAMEAINGKWKLLILISIQNGNLRFSQIENSIPKISAKVLSKELKDLEQSDLIERNVYDDYPVRIEYKTTEHAKSLKSVFNELTKWGQLHRKHIIRKKLSTSSEAL